MRHHFTVLLIGRDNGNSRFHGVKCSMVLALFRECCKKSELYREIECTMHSKLTLGSVK